MLEREMKTCTLLFLLIHLALAASAQDRREPNLNAPPQEDSGNRYKTHRYVRGHTDHITSVPEALESSSGEDSQRSRTNDDGTAVDTNSNGRRDDMERNNTKRVGTDINSRGEIIAGNRPLHISIPVESETRNSVVQIPVVEDSHKTGSVGSSHIVGNIGNGTINKQRIVENGSSEIGEKINVLLPNTLETLQINQTNDKANNLESQKDDPNIEDSSEESQAREMDKIVKHYENMMLTERQFEEENESPMEDNDFEDSVKNIKSNVQARVKRFDNAENFAEAMSLINSLPLIDIASMVGQTDDSFETSTSGGEEKALPDEESATNKDAEFRTVITFEEKLGLENIENGSSNLADAQFSSKTEGVSPVTNDPMGSTEITISVVENRELEKDITTAKVELTDNKTLEENFGSLNVTNESSTEKELNYLPSEFLRKESVVENINLEELPKDVSETIPEVSQLETATQVINSSLDSKSIPSVHTETTAITESLKSVADVLTTERLPKVATEVSMMKSVSMSVSVGDKGESSKQVNTSDISRIIELSVESSTRNTSISDESTKSTVKETDSNKDNRTLDSNNLTEKVNIKNGEVNNERNVVDYTSTVRSKLIKEIKQSTQDKLIPDEYSINSQVNVREQGTTDETSTYSGEGNQPGRNNSELTLESSKDTTKKITENITNENKLKPLPLQDIEKEKRNDLSGIAEVVKTDGKINDETAQEILQQRKIIDGRSEPEPINTSLTINNSDQTNNTKISEVTTVNGQMNNETAQEQPIKNDYGIVTTVVNTSLTRDNTNQTKNNDKQNIEEIEGITPTISNTLVVTHNGNQTDNNNDTVKIEELKESEADKKAILPISENSTDEGNGGEKFGTLNSTVSTTEPFFFVYKTITEVIESENISTESENNSTELENNFTTTNANNDIKSPSTTTQDESAENVTLDISIKNNFLRNNIQLDNGTISEDNIQTQNTTEAPKEKNIEKGNLRLDTTPIIDLNTSNNTPESYTNSESKKTNDNSDDGKKINNNSLYTIEETNQNKMKEINKFNLRPRPKYQSPIYKKKQLPQQASSGEKLLENSTTDEIQAHQKMVNNRRIIMDEMNSQVVQDEVQLLLSKDEHRFSPSTKIKNRSQKIEGRESFRDRFGSRPIAGLQNKSKSNKKEETLENNEKIAKSNDESNGGNIDELVDREGTDVTAPTLSEIDANSRVDKDANNTTELSTRERLIQIRKEKIKNSYIKSIQNYRNNEKVKNLKSDELKNKITAMIEHNLEEQLTSSKKFTNIQKLNESDEDGAVRQRVIYTPIRTPKPGFRIPVNKLFTDDSPSNIGTRKKYTRTNFRENKSDVTVAKDSEDYRGRDQTTTERKPTRTFNRKPTPKYIFSDLMTEKPPPARPQFKPSTSKTRKTTTTSTTTTEDPLDFETVTEDESDITPPPTTPESLQTRPPTTTKPKPSIENVQNRLVKVEPRRKINKGNVPFKIQPITTRSNSPNRFSILKQKVTSPPAAIQTTRTQPEIEDGSSEEFVTAVPNERDELVPGTADTLDSSSEAPILIIRDQSVNLQKGEPKDTTNIRPMPKRIIKQRYNVGNQNLHPRLLRAMQLRSS